MDTRWAPTSYQFVNGVMGPLVNGLLKRVTGVKIPSPACRIVDSSISFWDNLFWEAMLASGSVILPLPWIHKTLFVSAEFVFFQVHFVATERAVLCGWQYVGESCQCRARHVCVVDRATTFDDGINHTKMLGKQGFRIGGIDLPSSQVG